MAEQPLNDLDPRILEAAQASAADSFGPHFAERTVKLALDGAEAQRSALGRPALGRPALGRILRPALALAAVLLLLSVGDRFRTRTVQTDPGTTQLVSLPDGTEVNLSGGSLLSWKPFGRVRQVNLEGQAFFVVSSNGKPFEVATFNATVVVTGTRFNVRSWPEAVQPETWVALEEGGVTLQKPGGAALALTPGQSAVANKDGLAMAPDRRIADAVSWRAGGIALIDLPLSDALDALEHRFNVELSTSAELAARPTTFVTPRAMGLEEILDAICFALDLRYRPILNGFQIESTQQ
ncbi:MAG: transmembrane sensor [Rhodothermales bacterium]|jgi:transmembrane sensor